MDNEIKVGDIVRMKLGVGWVPEVEQWIGQPLVVHKITSSDSFGLRTLSGENLENPKSFSSEFKDWRFSPGNLEHDVFLMAVRRSRQ
jgi:hypothetical protein